MHRILLVDDDDATRTMVKERLKDSYDVVDTADPKEALSMALDLSPRCIVMDLLMPGLTGFELCKTLSSMTLTQEMPVLVLSGNPPEDYEDYCSHLGARDYFQKPVDFKKLSARISELVDQDAAEIPPEVHLGLRVCIELRGLNRFGKPFHELTATEDVSANGFRCVCGADLESKSVVEVFLRSGETKRRVGRARLVHAAIRRRQAPQYGFQFMQRPVEWLL